MTPPEEVVGAQSSGATAVPAPLSQSRIQLELPFEVKHRFRTKALTLVTLETWIVLSVTLLCDSVLSVEKLATFIIMSSSLLLAMGSLGLFWWWRHRFPANYLLLLVTTLLAGTFWSFTENSLFNAEVNMPVQVCIVMATMMTTWLLTAQIRSKLYELEILFGGIQLGWLIGSLADFAYLYFAGLPLASAALPILGIFFASLLIFAAIGKPMVRCYADDYMIVALAFTANLFLLVSVPVILMLVVAGGSLWTGSPGPNNEEEQQQENPPPRPQIPEIAQGEPEQEPPMI